jgi:hypothetical protein
LTDKRRHSNTVDIQSFRGADWDTDHYLVTAKVKWRLSVSKRVAQNFDMERFNLNNLNGVEVKEECQFKIKRRFAALGNLDHDDYVDINIAWEGIREV